MKHHNGRVAVIDDDEDMRSLLKLFFDSKGFVVETFSGAAQACEALSVGGSLGPEKEDGDVDLIISDVCMSGMDGLEFMAQLHILRAEIPVILMTAFGSIETAIEATKRGAFNYIVKPFKLAEFAIHVERAMEYRRLKRDNTALRREVKQTWIMSGIIGKSPRMIEIFDLIKRVAPANANVLITGESGSGKEAVARAIHQNGPRANKPFVDINCTAIPETLLETELFGHAKGSFTGAFQRKKGLFEMAEGGTLFLDEIGDMNIAVQAKLLRIIQDRKLRSVGDTFSRDINVRIIAATHKDLRVAIKEGLFREDLYYRLSVIPIIIPPLRQRKEDIPFLAEHFLSKHAATNHSHVTGFTKRAMAKLMSLRWDGNVRELENVIERAVILATELLIDEKDIPSLEAVTSEQFFSSAISDFPTLEQLESRYIQLILDKTAGRKDKAAQILGINRRTIYRRERDHGLLSDESGDTNRSGQSFVF